MRDGGNLHKLTIEKKQWYRKGEYSMNYQKKISKEEIKMNNFYVYGAWDTNDENLNAKNALYIGKGSGDRLNADHPNIPNYDKLKKGKFDGLTNLTEEKAFAEEKRLIETYKPKYNENY